MSAREFHLTIDGDNITAVDALAALTGLPKGRIKDALNKGAGWLRSGRAEKRLRRATHMLKRGDQISLYYDEEVLRREVSAPQLIADEHEYSIWNKPAQMLAQGTQYGDHCSLLRWCEKYFSPARKCFLVHRLDREAEGLMLIAHTSKAAAAFSALWQKRDIEKKYSVIVEGMAGAIGHSQRIESELDGKPSISEFTVIDCDSATHRSVLAVTLITGRKHQIRRHLASIGLPVVGDYRYGRGGDALALRAIALQFDCPIDKRRKLFSIEPYR
jgi:tRNA pseudouridine32 synthase/23S rRNA pseudouridine746 synthase